MIILKTDSTFKLPPVDDKSKKIMKNLKRPEIGFLRA